MAPRIKETPALGGVSGGENVTAAEVDHGLGRRDDMIEVLSEKAHQQGIENYTLTPANQQNANSSGGGGTGNLIAVPLQQVLLDQVDPGLAAYYSTFDPADAEARQLADRATEDAIRDLVSPLAILFVPPDEFTNLRIDLERMAQELIKETRALAAKRCHKKLPSEENLKRGLERDIHARHFRDRHNALFHYIHAANQAPETGIPAIACIDGEYGSIGAEHGRYIGTLPSKRS